MRIHISKPKKYNLRDLLRPLDIITSIFNKHYNFPSFIYSCIGIARILCLSAFFKFSQMRKNPQSIREI